MNANARTAITAAANPDPIAWAASIAGEGQDRMAEMGAEVSASTQAANAATPELVSKDAAQLDAARIEARSEGLTAGKAVGFIEGHAKGLEEGHSKGLDAVGVKPGDLNAYSRGRDAALALFGKKPVGDSAAQRHYEEGQAAARALGKTVGDSVEQRKFAEGQAAAMAILGKKAERPLAHT
jgi:hypothetical protein